MIAAARAVLAINAAYDLLCGAALLGAGPPIFRAPHTFLLWTHPVLPTHAIGAFVLSQAIPRALAAAWPRQFLFAAVASYLAEAAVVLACAFLTKAILGHSAAFIVLSCAALAAALLVLP